jgi:hypothetical protein
MIPMVLSQLVVDSRQNVILEATSKPHIERSVDSRAFMI